MLESTLAPGKYLARTLRPLVIALIGGGVLGFPAGAPAQEETHTGTFAELWTDPAPGSPLAPSVDYFLLQDDGGWLELEIRPEMLRSLGGPMALLRKRIAVTGIRELLEAPARRSEGTLFRGRFHVSSVRLVSPLAANIPDAPLPPVQRYVTVLCRFPQSTDDGVRTLEAYRLWMGSEPPGMGHYWDALSAGQLEFHGEVVVGWYELPEPLEYYFEDPLPGDRVKPDWGLLARDCSGLADEDVDFTLMDGVNLQFNLNFGASWGGASMLALDGPSRPFGVTWMAAWSGQSIYAHEIGHTFGLPHSSGPYNATYDSRWDVMSHSRVFRDPVLYTWIGQHTIMHHRDLLGWIPPEQRVTADRFGATETLILDVWDAPQPSGWNLVEIPLSDGTFYTVEARRQAGYDQGIPFSGVLLHRVDPMRNGRRAQVVDTDLDGDPNDERAIWTVGETFEDWVDGVTLEVTESYLDGSGPPAAYRIDVSRGWWLDITISGQGRVLSQDGDLECSEDCSELFGTHADLVLQAEPAEGLAFAGWGGVCGGSEFCRVVLTSRQFVFAEFVPPLVIVTEPDRPTGVMGAPYEDTFQVTGGTGTQTWSLSDGSLPEGLTLDPSLGTVTGVPEESGDFDFQLSVTYKQLTTTGSFHVRVERPTLSRQDVIDELLSPGSTLDPDEKRYLDLAGNRNGRFDLGDVLLYLKGGGQ